uniref:Ankyrin repeat and LEM domain containing 1 n=1 Tax=Naja naja TaxID=35670 RepID=A0A8C6V427_NAJNA
SVLASRIARDLRAPLPLFCRMVAALLREGADPNLVLPEGVAPMHLAAGLEQENGIRRLRLLLQHGGDPNVRSGEGLTPLHVAASWGCTAGLRILLAEGGDPQVEDQVGPKASLPRGTLDAQLRSMMLATKVLPSWQKCCPAPAWPQSPPMGTLPQQTSPQAGAAGLAHWPSLAGEAEEMGEGRAVSAPPTPRKPPGNLGLCSLGGSLASARGGGREDPSSRTRSEAGSPPVGGAAQDPPEGGPLESLAARGPLGKQAEKASRVSFSRLSAGGGVPVFDPLPGEILDGGGIGPARAPSGGPGSFGGPGLAPLLCSAYSPELASALHTYRIPSSKADELALAAEFDQPDKSRKWREGLLKSSFNYLLLDPRVTQNLPARCQLLSPAEAFQTFVRAVFYVGKGTRGRPYRHLYEALGHYWKGQGMPATQASSKVRHILEIWARGQGVVSMHCFQNVVPVEAYTREACMVDAIGELLRLGGGWPMKRRRSLGVFLLHRALQIFLAEGERQLRPTDI